MGTITRNFANNLTTSGVLQPGAFNNSSFDSVTSVPEGAVESGGYVKLSTSTASADANIDFSFTGSYDEYVFHYTNIHPATDNAQFMINFSTDSGSNYNVNKTNTIFLSQHGEATESSVGIFYKDTLDVANGTGNVMLQVDSGADNDQSTSGWIRIFAPHDTTYIKHFISRCHYSQSGDYAINSFVSGYANTTSALTNIRFTMNTGNIDAGTIEMYGVS
jgi:hypothetical protein